MTFRERERYSGILKEDDLRYKAILNENKDQIEIMRNKSHAVTCNTKPEAMIPELSKLDTKSRLNAGPGEIVDNSRHALD